MHQQGQDLTEKAWRAFLITRDLAKGSESHAELGACRRGLSLCWDYRHVLPCLAFNSYVGTGNWIWAPLLASIVPIKLSLQPWHYFFDQQASLKITLQIIKHSIDSQRQGYGDSSNRHCKDETTESMRPTWATLQESVSKQQQEPPTKPQKNKTKISEIRKMEREKKNLSWKEGRSARNRRADSWSLRIKHRWTQAGSTTQLY